MRGGGVTTSAPSALFYIQQASGQISIDDVNGFSSTSDICFMLVYNHYRRRILLPTVLHITFQEGASIVSLSFNILTRARTLRDRRPQSSQGGKNLLYQHNKPNEPTFKLPFTLVSTVSGDHPYVVSLILINKRSEVQAMCMVFPYCTCKWKGNVLKQRSYPLYTCILNTENTSVDELTSKILYIFHTSPIPYQSNSKSRIMIDLYKKNWICYKDTSSSFDAPGKGFTILATIEEGRAASESPH